MQVDFDLVKEKFKNSNTDDKIEIYLTTEGLTKEQYLELLRMFPLNEFHKLEEAMKS